MIDHQKGAYEEVIPISSHILSINIGSTHTLCTYTIKNQSGLLGAQWLSGIVLDSRPRGRGFEPHRRHYVVSFEQDTFILA